MIVSITSAKKVASFIKTAVGVLTITISVISLVGVLLEKKNETFTEVLDELSSKLLGN